MAFQDQLLSIVQKAANAPFLFAGSGFSMRYIGTENWANLLARFCECGRAFQYYSSKASNDYPAAASLLADDYHQLWFSNAKFGQQRDLYTTDMREVADPLKLEISQYFKEVSKRALDSLQHSEEIDALKAATIDGIITTNWDTSLETFFPAYKPYVGQGSILRSCPSGFAEIYKIHGCCTDFRSLVLTSQDYDKYNQRNHYLAAKLVTIFVEHPVLFVGYSLSDLNIQDILTNIVNCVGKDHISLLHDRLLFVNYDSHVEQPYIDTTVFKADGGTIPITMIHASNFLPIYEVLGRVKRKIPTRLLRHLKEQIMQLASISETSSKVAVLDIGDDTDLSKVDCVVGVGVASKLAEKGYSQIEIGDVIADFLYEGLKLPPERMVKVVFPRLLKQSPYFPFFGYLRKIGITDSTSYAAANLGLDKATSITHDQLVSSVYSYLEGKFADTSFDELVATFDPVKVLHYLPMLKPENIDTQSLRGYLQRLYNKDTLKNTSFRKAVCVLDRLEFGWK